jgi:hypothetical protein
VTAVWIVLACLTPSAIVATLGALRAHHRRDRASGRRSAEQTLARETPHPRPERRSDHNRHSETRHS